MNNKKKTGWMGQAPSPKPGGSSVGTRFLSDRGTKPEWFDESGLDSAAICVQSMEQNCTKSYSQLDISNILL